MTKVWLAVGLLVALAGGVRSVERVQVALDTAEADAVLAILDKRAAGTMVEAADWQRLFATEPYRRLKVREDAVHRPLTDEAFERFVSSDDLTPRRAALASILAEWKAADLAAAARQTLAYLPASAVIRAKVFAEIKPRDNSFVFDVDRDPAIFLALSEKMTKDRFANTVAHELHHIGLASTDRQYEERMASLPPRAKKAAMWVGAFGEGLAMLAAAGGLDVSPVAAEGPEEKANWSDGMAHLDRAFAELDAFFIQVLDGTLEGDAADRKAATFFGNVRGPWYFVGYWMGATVERRLGKDALIACMLDYRQLLVDYQATGTTPRWSEAVVSHLFD